MTREILFHALAFSFKIYPESDFLLTEPESPFACLFTALYFGMAQLIGMQYILPQRDLIAASAEAMIKAHGFKSADIGKQAETQ